jgi:hypothetical protein
MTAAEAPEGTSYVALKDRVVNLGSKNCDLDCPAGMSKMTFAFVPCKFKTDEAVKA